MKLSIFSSLRVYTTLSVGLLSHTLSIGNKESFAYCCRVKRKGLYSCEFECPSDGVLIEAW